jgi:hypothetical protein
MEERVSNWFSKLANNLQLDQVYGFRYYIKIPWLNYKNYLEVLCQRSRELTEERVSLAYWNESILKFKEITIVLSNIIPKRLSQVVNELNETTNRLREENMSSISE